MPTKHRAIGLVVGIGVTFAALTLAFLVVGPAMRWFVGPPPGFGTDYTSSAAFTHALIAQCLTLGAAFLVTGVVARGWVRGGGLRWALWVANPLTAWLGYWLFRSMPWADEIYEYRGYPGWLLLTLLAPLLFPLCIYVGARLFEARQPGGGDIVVKQ